MTTTSNNLNWWERITLEVLWILCRLFGLLPLFVQYRIVAPFIYFVVYKVFRYRVKVVDDNLAHAFADRSEVERAEIKDKFYTTLSEVFVSIIALSNPRMEGKFEDPNDMTTQAAKLREQMKGRNWVALLAHIGLWEHMMFWGEYSDSYILGAYHKLANRVVDQLFIRLRTRNHINFIALEKKYIARFCIKHRDGIEGKNFVLGLIADQHSTIYADSRWIDFLGRETIFFDGGETLALKLKLPVYFIYYRRVGAGKYTLHYDMLHDGVEEVEPYEITRCYVRHLEREIRETPELWLWSHKRWKRKKRT